MTALTSGVLCDSGLQLCLLPISCIFGREVNEAEGERFSASSRMFSLFLDLCIAAKSSSLVIVLFVGDKMRFVGVLRPELGRDVDFMPDIASRSATLGLGLLVGVDVLKPFSGAMGEKGACWRVSIAGDLLSGSCTGEDAKSR